MGGLHEFDDYVYGVHPWQFSGARIVEILDTFAAKLQMHLTDEIVWILSLAQYPNLDLAGIDAQHGLFVKARSSLTRLLPFFMTNHDVCFTLLSPSGELLPNMDARSHTKTRSTAGGPQTLRSETSFCDTSVRSFTAAHGSTAAARSPESPRT